MTEGWYTLFVFAGRVHGRQSTLPVNMAPVSTGSVYRVTVNTT